MELVYLSRKDVERLRLIMAILRASHPGRGTGSGQSIPVGQSILRRIESFGRTKGLVY